MLRRSMAALLVLGLTALPAPGAPARSASAAATTAAPVAAFALPVPAPLVVLVPFAPPPDRSAAGHRGVDLATVVGTVIVAAGAGRVVYAGHLVDRGVVS